MPSTYLTRTSTAGNRQKFTTSFWFKLAKADSTRMSFFSATETTNGNELSYMRVDDKIWIRESHSNNSDLILETNRLFRDVNSWYHVVFAVDTTQATSTDRVKLWVNGVQETSFASATYPSQNYNTRWNESGQVMQIGRNVSAYPYYFDGSMSHFHHCDGYAYDPSAFGSVDNLSGEWRINPNPNVQYGNNGFFILKDGNSVTDQSPNTNNFTVAGGTLTKTEDNPSNVFATMNPLYKWDNVMNYSNGNTSLTGTGNNWQGSIATLGISSGKYYYEAKFTSATAMDNWYIGFNGLDDYNTSAPYRNGVKFYNHDGGEIYVGDTGTNGFTTANYGTFSNGDIIGIALDYDNETMSVYKNGSAIVTNYDYGSQTYSSTIKDGKTIAPCVSHYGSGSISFNFGNGFFGTQEITTNTGTGFQDADGNGRFFYNPPTNFRCLSTKGLNQ